MKAARPAWSGPVAEEYLIRVDVESGDVLTAMEQVADSTDEMCPTEAVRTLTAVCRQAADDSDELGAAPGVLRRRRWRYAVAHHPRVETLIAQHRERASHYGVPSTLTAKDWASILASHQGACAYCGTSDERLTLDHVVPMSRGGANTAENVAACCRACNASKNAGHLFDWLERVSLDSDAAFRRLNTARDRRRAISRRQSSAVVGSQDPSKRP